jgi:hypothetical protein
MANNLGPYYDKQGTSEAYHSDWAAGPIERPMQKIDAAGTPHPQIGKAAPITAQEKDPIRSPADPVKMDGP